MLINEILRKVGDLDDVRFSVGLDIENDKTSSSSRKLIEESEMVRSLHE